ncbi:hypothetical protein [Pantoea agglomerans]|uniref:hypothetical protein n=1 Tax=Enterobacter agglomerans TaxID=549 RepID=UPI003BA2386F
MSQTEFIAQMAVLLHLYIQPSKGYASSAEVEKAAGVWERAGDLPAAALNQGSDAPEWRIALVDFIAI